MTENKRNILIGLTVLTGLAMLAVMIFLFAGLPEMFHTGYKITMYFDRTHDIQPGDPIYLLGKRVGVISTVDFTDNDPTKGVTITAKVERNVRLPSNIYVKVFKYGLAGKAYVSLVAEGKYKIDPATGQSILFYSTDDKIVLKGRHDGGKSSLIPEELIDGLKEFGKLAKNLNALIAPEPSKTPGGKTKDDELNGGLRGTVARMNKTLDALHAIVGDPKNKENVKATLGNLAKASETAEQLMHRLIEDGEILAATLKEFKTAGQKMHCGKGSVAKLLNDPQLYKNMLAITEQMEALLKNFRRIAADWEKDGMKVKLK